MQSVPIWENMLLQLGVSVFSVRSVLPKCYGLDYVPQNSC